MNKTRLTLFTLCLFCVLSITAQTKSKIIAHRGHWNVAGTSQNSLKSLVNAHDVKVYGSEFDVYLTADNVLIVYHDDKVDGRRIADLNYKDLTKMRLLSGERVPTLESYLKKAKKLEGLKLIFELKSHLTPERNREAARKSVEMVDKMGLTDRTEYITFNLDAGKELIRVSPNTPVFYLNGELSPAELKELGFAGLDYHFNVMKKNPQWFEECRKLGLKTNVWTVNDTAMMNEMIGLGADFITTDAPEQALELVK